MILAPNTPFALTQEHADAINALLPDCKYVVGIRENETGEVRFCPQEMPRKWNEDDDATSLWWWSTGNMSCDCNRELDFRRADGESLDFDDVSCSDGRYTVVGIWFPDGGEYRDLMRLNDF